MFTSIILKKWNVILNREKWIFIIFFFYDLVLFLLYFGEQESI